MNEMDSIGKLYKEKFSALSMPHNPEKGWTKISSVLRRKRFFRFYLYRFNAYYALSLILLLISGSLLLPASHENSLKPSDSARNIQKSNLPGSIVKKEKQEIPSILTDSTYKVKEKINEGINTEAPYEKPTSTKAVKPSAVENKAGKPSMQYKQKEVKYLDTEPLKEREDLSTGDSVISILGVQKEKATVPQTFTDSTEPVKAPAPIYITRQDTVLIIDSLPKRNRKK